MTDRSPVRSLGPILMMAGALAVFLWVYLRLSSFMLDDTFISLRYARNLVAGHGLIYNVGERVEGYTNFLWTFVLASAYAARADPFLFVKVACAVVVVATAFFVFRLGRVSLLAPGEGVPEWLAAIPVVAFLLTPSVVVSAAEGLETVFFTLLLVLAVVRFFDEARPGAFPHTATVLAALAMTRPDGVVYAPAAFIAATLARRPRAYLVQFLVVFFGLYGTYFVARALYYGQLLPNTFYAKGGGDAVAFRRGLRETLRFVQECGGWGWLAAIVPVFMRRMRPAALVLAGVIVIRLVFELWSGGAWIGRYRFLIPTLPFLYVLAVGGLAAMVPQPGVRRIAIAALCVGLVLPGWMLYPRTEAETLASGAGLQRAHRALGEKIAQQTSPDAVIAMDDAGLCPLASERTTIDMLGLNDAHIGRLKGRFAYKYDVRYVLDRRPDLIVLISGIPAPAREEDLRLAGNAAMFREPEFRAAYRYVQSYRFHDTYYLAVYRRQDSVAVPEDF